MKQLKTICPHCNKEIILTQDKTNNIISENDLSEKNIEIMLENIGIYLGVVEKGGE